MKNIPERIYLQIGDLTDKDDKNIDFNELSDVCWSCEKIFKTDIEYIRKPDAARKSVESIAKEINGIIPLIYKRIICILWKGHNYIPISPEDVYGKRLFECKYCKKQHVW